MSSKYSEQLIDSIASWTNEDNLDASAEELLDFFADLSATEAADIIAAYTVIDRAGEMNYTGKLPQSAAWLASDGYCNEELFSREKQYAIGKRLLVHSNQYASHARVAAREAGEAAHTGAGQLQIEAPLHLTTTLPQNHNGSRS